MNEMPSETQNCPTCRKNMSVRCQARPDTVFPSQMDWWWWCSDCHYPSRPTMGFSLSPADRERWQQTVVEDDVTPDSWASALEVRVAALKAAQTPVEATPVESQRERNGRLFWEALYPKEPWSLTYPETREKYMNGAERFIAAAQPPSDETEATPVESERERKGRLLFEIMDDDQCYRWKDIGASTQIYWNTVAEQFVTQCQAKPDYTALRTWLNEQNNEAVDRWYLRQQDHLPFTLRVTAPMPEEVHAYQKVWAWLDEHEAHHE